MWLNITESGRNGLLLVVLYSHKSMGVFFRKELKKGRLWIDRYLNREDSPSTTRQFNRGIPDRAAAPHNHKLISILTRQFFEFFKQASNQNSKTRLHWSITKSSLKNKKWKETRRTFVLPFWCWDWLFCDGRDRKTGENKRTLIKWKGVVDAFEKLFA